MVRKDQEAAEVKALYMPFCRLINVLKSPDMHSVATITKGICLGRAVLFAV
jgi:hypothetical protein